MLKAYRDIFEMITPHSLLPSAKYTVLILLLNNRAGFESSFKIQKIDTLS